MPGLPRSSAPDHQHPAFEHAFSARKQGINVKPAASNFIVVAVLIIGSIFLVLNVYHNSTSEFLCKGDAGDLRIVSSSSLSSTSAVSRSFQLGIHESLGFFDDIDDDAWKLHQERARGEPFYSRPRDPNYQLASRPAIWMVNNVDPIFTCPHTRRVGGRGDGPKYMCDPHRLKKKDDCLIYSVGSAGRYQFEDGLFNLLKDDNNVNNCEIHVFDPNPKYARRNDAKTKNIHYHAWGLKSSYTESQEFGGFEFLTIYQTLERLGHTSRRIDSLKIDCEGCEFGSYKDWLDPKIDIRNILIEVHMTGEGLKEGSKFFDSFLDRGFVPYSKEANTLPFAKPTGCLFEYGFQRMHKDFLARNRSEEVQQ